MKKKYWLIVLVLMFLIIHMSAVEVKKKKSVTKKKNSKTLKSSKIAKNSRTKPQADVPLSNGDDFEDDYDYDYDSGMVPEDAFNLLQ